MPVGIGSWMPMMVTDEIDLGVLNSTDARWGYLGIKRYKKISRGKGFPIRLLFTGLCNDVSIVVSGKCPASKSSELKGLSIAAGFAKAPACQLQTTAVLADGGLTWKDVKLVPVAAPGAAVKAVLEGRADAAGTATTGMPAVEELAAKKGARFISLDPSPEAKARALRVYPDGWFHLVKGGKYAGVEKDTWLLRYEIYMRYFLLNMLRIKNPYAYTALGSAMAFPVWAYKKLGGLTPVMSGEDFYFLQKLRKSGNLGIWTNTIAYPSARFSDRVNFGTGPALIKGETGDWDSYPIYYYQLFDKVKETFDLFPTLFKRDVTTPMDEFLKKQFGSNEIWKPLRDNYKDEKNFVKACVAKVDGLRILQFLKLSQQSESVDNCPWVNL